MVARSDGKSYTEESVVDPDLCVSCGICVGACPTASPFRSRTELVPGIDMPELPAAQLRENIRAASYRDDHDVRVLAFCCEGNPVGDKLQESGEAVVYVNCVGQIPPAYFDYALSRGFTDSILLTACAGGVCRHRFGADWTEQRISRIRDPHLRKRIDKNKIAMIWRDGEIAPDRISAHVGKLRSSQAVLDQAGDGK